MYNGIDTPSSRVRRIRNNFRLDMLRMWDLRSKYNMLARKEYIATSGTDCSKTGTEVKTWCNGVISKYGGAVWKVCFFGKLLRCLLEIATDGVLKERALGRTSGSKSPEALIVK